MIRSPLHVLPSYFKFLYRYELNHGPDAEVPIGEWVVWRNENLEEQMGKWVEHTRWWLKNYGRCKTCDSHSLLIVQFEKLISPKDGPETLMQISDFLSYAEPAIAEMVANSTDIPCLWNLLIGVSMPTKPGDVLQKYPYTVPQLAMILNSLKSLQKEFSGDAYAALFLPEYIKIVSVAKRQVEKLVES